MDIGNISLTNYVLEQRLMDFLSFRQRIGELIDSGHVDGSYANDIQNYKITDKGRELLTLMSGLMPVTEKNRVDRTYRSLRRSIINERAVTAFYTPEDEYRNVVRVELNEGEFSILSLNIAVASKAEAIAICENWKSDTAGIYSKIVNTLLNAKESDDKTFEPLGVQEGK